MPQVLRLNGGSPVTSLENGARFSCSVSNPAISGNNVTRDYTLNVRCRIQIDIYTDMQQLFHEESYLKSLIKFHFNRK